MKVEIYDPAMCCSSGMCGPSIDPVLLKINEAVLTLKKQGVEVARYNLTQEPKEYMNNKKVAALLQKEGKKALPITLVNDEVFMSGTYPTYEDLCGNLGIEPIKITKPLGFIN